MIFIPAIYFSAFLIHVVKKQGFDIAAYIILLYLVTGIFSIFLYYSDPIYSQKQITIIPAVFYCLFLTITIAPFIRIRSAQRIIIPYINEKVFNIIVFVYIFSFIFTIILFWNDMVFRLLTADFKEMRGDDSVFMQTAQSRLSGGLRLISNVFGILNIFSSIMVLFFFFSLCFLKKSKMYNIIILISSLSCVMMAIINIDRSIVFYWILLFGFCYTLFRPYMKKKENRFVIKVGLIAIALILVYFVAITISRFGNTDDGNGALASVINYAGQNYIEFCWFWDNFSLPKHNLSGIFPAFHHFILGDSMGPVSYGLSIESKVGFFVNKFYTFMGSIMIYLGQPFVPFFCILFSLLVFSLFKTSRHFTLGQLIRLYIIAEIPACGVILYPYTSYMSTTAALLFLLVSFYISKKQRIIKLH